MYTSHNFTHLISIYGYRASKIKIYSVMTYKMMSHTKRPCHSISLRNKLGWDPFSLPWEPSRLRIKKQEQLDSASTSAAHFPVQSLLIFFKLKRALPFPLESCPTLFVFLTGVYAILSLIYIFSQLGNVDVPPIFILNKCFALKLSLFVHICWQIFTWLQPHMLFEGQVHLVSVL